MKNRVNDHPTPGHAELKEYHRVCSNSTLALSKGIHLFVLLFLITSLAIQAQNFGLVGWATQSGGTTGGAGGDQVTVSTGTALQNAINGASGPRIIYINGTITESNSPGTKIDIKDVEDISIIGVGTSGEMDGVGLKVWRSSNIIIRNLKIHHVEAPDDCISIEGPADHVWVDHNELYNQFDGVGKDDYDGLLDTKRDAEYLTYSWNYLHDSWKASLVGSSETDDDDRKVTYHHNRFENINSRLPLFRGGQGHVYNNLYEDIETGCVNSRLDACVKIENNYFDNAKNPWYSKDSDVVGDVDVSGNTITGGSSFSPSTPLTGTCNASIPYSYSAQSASAARSSILSCAGIGKLGNSSCDDEDNGSGNDPVEIESVSASSSGSSITVSWNLSGSPINSQRVYRDTDSNPNGRTLIADLNGSPRSYTDNSLSSGTYYYWVKINNDLTNDTPASATIGGSGSGDPIASLSSSVSGSSVNLSWSYSGGSISGQEVYRDTDSNPSGRVRIASISSSDRSYNDSPGNGTYYYWIKTNASYNSNLAEGTIGSPGTPSITLSASSGNGEVDLSWVTSGGPVTGQEVYRDTDSDPNGRVRIESVSAATRSYTDNSASNGTTYYYWIKVNASVNSNAAQANPSSSRVASSVNEVLENNNDLTLYPVPTNDFLTIDGIAKQASIRVINIQGIEVVPLQKINGKTKLSLSHLKKGLYIMEVVSEAGVKQNKRFLVR